MSSPNQAEEGGLNPNRVQNRLTQMFGTNIGNLTSPKSALSGMLQRPPSGHLDTSLNGGGSSGDLLVYSFRVSFKGQIASVELPGTSTYTELFDKSLDRLPEKLRKEAVDRFLFWKETSIHLPNSRRIDSILIVPEFGDVIELELKKKDKKGFPLVVLFEGRTEIVEVNPNTTIQGVIQLLPRKDIDDEFLNLFNKKGRLDPREKVMNHIKKDEVLECRLDQELKSAGAGFTSNKKKNNRKSVALKRPITPSGSSTNLSPMPNRGSDGKKVLDKFLQNRPSEAELKKKNILVDVHTDAKASAPAAVDPNSALPLQLKIFVQLGTYLKEHLDLVGLFRVSGDVEDIKRFYESFWTGQPKWETMHNDPHVASSALKLYLRKQADPLIPFAHYTEFLACQNLDEEEQQLTAFKTAISKLPEPNASIFHYLIHLLSLVASKEDVNKMSPHNIGIVFGPTIMWDPKPNVMDYSSTGYQSSLVSNLITHYSTLWTTPVPDANVAAVKINRAAQRPTDLVQAKAATMASLPKLRPPLPKGPPPTSATFSSMPGTASATNPAATSSTGPTVPPSQATPSNPATRPPPSLGVPPPGPPKQQAPKQPPKQPSLSPELARNSSRKSWLFSDGVQIQEGEPTPSPMQRSSSSLQTGSPSQTRMHKRLSSGPSSVGAGGVASDDSLVSLGTTAKAAAIFSNVKSELTTALPLGSCPISSAVASDPGQLLAILKAQPHEDLVQYLCSIMSAFAEKQ